MNRKICLIFILASCLLLSACRESPVLMQEVYLQEQEEIDEEQEQLDEDADGEEDEDFSDELEEDTDSLEETEPDEGVYEEPEQAPEPTPPPRSAEIEYNENQNVEGDVAHAEEPAEAPGAAESEEEPEPEPEPDDTEERDTDLDTESEDGEQAADGGEGYRQVVDATGALIDVPGNVETVAAVGAAAQMVEMLGGAGRLAAADAAFLSSPLAQFSDKNEIKPLWYGSGDSGISDDGFQALLDAEPGAVLVVSGQYSLSEAQAEALAEAGIPVVTLYPLSSMENLKNAVYIAGQVLGNVNGVDAPAAADGYMRWVDGLVSEVGGRTNDLDLSSLYIAGWDDGARYVLGADTGDIPGEGTGLAYAYSPRIAQMAGAAMKAAHVTNESTRIAGMHRTSNYVYVTPMFRNLNATVTGSKATYYSGGGETPVAYDLFISRQASDSVYYQLGGSAFPAVVVADGDVKAKLEDNWFWQYHETDGQYIYAGQRFYVAIIGEYDIYVNPKGMLDWAAGSVESPLESVWIACKLAGAYTMDEVRAKTADFYSRFFGMELTGAQLEAIFGE